MEEQSVPTLAEIERFAVDHISSRSELGADPAFPHDLWRAMGQAGLLGLGLSPAHGGSGCDATALIEAGAALVEHGRNLGIVLSWSVQNLVGRYVLGQLGSETQRERYLPDLARGQLAISLAVSEPGMGGSPKRLSTRATAANGGYVLDGEKTYLTNGPIADLFVVVAVTGEADGLKQFSGFIVEKPRPGLELVAGAHIDFLRPSPHGGIVMRDCAVPGDSMLGEEGSALNAIFRRFRLIEDVVTLGPLLGGMRLQLSLLGAARSQSGVEVAGEQAETVGALTAGIAGVAVLAERLAHDLDGGAGEDDLVPLLLVARDFCGRFQTSFTEVCAVLQINDPILDAFSADMAKLSGLAGGAARARTRKLGLQTLRG
ncbi:MAG: hypothetical protein CMM08_16615 [Rhodospirillaceae bacterium]|nr:hypothetical protein [Rhodospirillaceae bacterium]